MRETLSVAFMDFAQRRRQFSFLALTAALLLLSVLVVPREAGTSFDVLTIEPEFIRQAGNPSWVFFAASLCASMLLPLLGFSFVLNSLSLDRQTGVHGIIAASQLGNVQYVAGKFVANLLMLAYMWLVLALGALGMSFMSYPGMGLVLVDFLLCFAVIAPGLVFVAAFAVFMEALMPKSKSLANTAGFVALFTCLIMALVSSAPIEGDSLVNGQLWDIGGSAAIMGQLSRSVETVLGRAPQTILILSGGGGTYGADNSLLPMVTLSFASLSASFWRSRIVILALAAMQVLLSALLWRRRVGNGFAANGLAKDEKPASKDPEANSASLHAYSAHAAAPAYSPAKQGHAPIVALVGHEMKLLVGKPSALWCLTVLGLWIGMWFADVAIASAVLCPLAFAVCVRLFSRGERLEYDRQALPVFATIKNGLRHQALLATGSSVLFSLVVTAPAIVRFAIAGQSRFSAAAIAYALFVPSTALLAGELTRTGRAFESLFLIWTYAVLNAPFLIGMDLDAAAGYGAAAVLAAVACASVVAFYLKRVHS